MKSTDHGDENFLQKIKQEYGIEKISLIENLIDFNREKEILQRLLLFQWWLLGEEVINYDLSTLVSLVADTNDPDCLFHKFRTSIQNYSYTDKFNIIPEGKIKGHSSLRDFPRKWAEQDIILTKVGKNYRLTELGRICGNYIFFKILIGEISKKDLLNLIQLEGNSYAKIFDEFDISDLIRLNIVQNKKNKSGNYNYTQNFIELIEFLHNFPELYPKELNMIQKSFSNKLFHQYISNLSANHRNLLKNKEDLTKIDIKSGKLSWIYNLNLISKDNRSFELKITNKSDLEKNPYKSRFHVLKSPGGYGKSIFLYQTALNNLLSLHNAKVGGKEERKDKKILIPIVISCRNLYLTSSGDKYRFFNNREKICEFKSHFQLNDSTIQKDLFLSLLYSVLKDNKYITKTTCQFFLKSISNYNILLIFDGWDEIESNSLKKCLLLLIGHIFEENVNLLCVIATRFIDQLLNNKLKYKSDQYSKKKYDPISIRLSLPTKENIFAYLSEFFETNQLTLQKFIEENNPKYTPLELYFLILFPKIEFPKYKYQLYERRILFDVLSDFYPITQIEKLESFTEISYLLDKKINNSVPILNNSSNFKQKKKKKEHSIELNNLLGKELAIRDLIYGKILSTNNGLSRNYSIISIMPYICYSSLYPLQYPPLDYNQCIEINPILKRFIAPQDDPSNNSLIAVLLDWHFMDFFLSDAIFQAFCNDESIQPVPYKSIEIFLKERFESIDKSRNLVIHKFQQYGIQNFADFLSMIYLESQIKFPPQKFRQDDYDPGDGGFSDPGMVVTMSVKTPPYGKELTETFRHEFNIAQKMKEYQKIPQILRLFNEFYIERPSIQRQMKMSEEPEFYPPEENHSPLEFFNLLTALFFRDQYSPESFEIIKYEEREDEYYMESSGFYVKKSNLSLDKNKERYWKKQDIIQILENMLRYSNEHIVPWLYEVYLKLPQQIKPSFNSNLLSQILYSTKNHIVQQASFNLLLRTNIEEIISNYQKFIKIGNKNLIDDFLQYYLPLISEKLVSKRDFSGFLRLLDCDFIDDAAKTMIYRHFIQVGLDLKQRETFFSRFKRISFYKPPNWDELLILQILLLQNLEKEEIEDQSYDSYNYYLIKNNITNFILHAIRRKYGFYFDFLMEIGFSIETIISNFKIYSIELVSKLQILLFKPDSEYDNGFGRLGREIAVHVRPRHYGELDTPEGKALIYKLKEKIKNSRSKFHNKDRYLEEISKLTDMLLYSHDKDLFYTDDFMEYYLNWTLPLYPANHKDYSEVAPQIFEFFKNLHLQSLEQKKKHHMIESRIKHFNYERIFFILNNHFYLIPENFRLKWIHLYYEWNFDFETFRILFYHLGESKIKHLYPMIWIKLDENRDFNRNSTHLRKERVSFYPNSNYWKITKETKEIYEENAKTVPFSFEGLLPFEEYNKFILHKLQFEENMHDFDINPFNPNDSRQIHPFLKIINNYFYFLAQYRRVEEYTDIFETFWKKYAFSKPITNQYHITHYIIYALSEAILRKIYPSLTNLDHKIAFLLCYKEKSKYHLELPYIEENSHFKMNLIRIYDEFGKFPREMIYQTIKKIATTGKKAFWFEELFMFTDLTLHTMDEIWIFIDTHLKGNNFGYHSENSHYFMIDYSNLAQATPELLKRWNLFQHLARIKNEKRKILDVVNFNKEYQDYASLIDHLENIAQYKFSEPFIPVLDISKIESFHEVQSQISKHLNDQKQEIGYYKQYPEDTLFYYFNEEESKILWAKESIITPKDEKEIMDPYDEYNGEEDEEEPFYRIEDKNDEKYKIWKEFTDDERNKVKDAREQDFDEQGFARLFFDELNDLQRKIFFSHHNNVLIWTPSPIFYFPTLKWVLKELHENPELQVFKIEYMMEVQGHFKQSSNELQILDKIFMYGFENNKLEEWYERLISEKNADDSLISLYVKYILQYLYSFNELGLIPNSIRKKGIASLLYSFMIQIARKLYENKKYG